MSEVCGRVTQSSPKPPRDRKGHWCWGGTWLPCTLCIPDSPHHHYYHRYCPCLFSSLRPCLSIRRHPSDKLWFPGKLVVNWVETQRWESIEGRWLTTFPSSVSLIAFSYPPPPRPYLLAQLVSNQSCGKGLKNLDLDFEHKNMLRELLPAIRATCDVTSVKGIQVRDNNDGRCLAQMDISCNSFNVFLLAANRNTLSVEVLTQETYM